MAAKAKAAEAPETHWAPNAPVAPGVERRVQELLLQPYRMVIHGDPEEGYLGECPELPGCITAGETPAEAMDLLRDAMAAWFTVALEHGRAIPDPQTEGETAYSGRVLLRMPPSLHRQVAALASQDSTSLNATLVSLLSQALGHRLARPAGEPPRTGGAAQISDPELAAQLRHLAEGGSGYSGGATRSPWGVPEKRP